MKRVYYNGYGNGTKEARHLRTGYEYEVEYEKNEGDNTFLVLKGVQVETGFNSNWFKVLPVFLGFSRQIPVVGAGIEDLHIWNNGDWHIVRDAIKVEKIYQLGEDVYEVYDKYRTFIIKVL